MCCMVRVIGASRCPQTIYWGDDPSPGLRLSVHWWLSVVTAETVMCRGVCQVAP